MCLRRPEARVWPSAAAEKQEILVFLVFELPVHGVHQMHRRAADLLLETGIDDLDAAVVLLGQVLGFFFGVGVAAEIAPSSGGISGVEGEYQKAFECHGSLALVRICSEGLYQSTEYQVPSTQYSVPSTEQLFLVS